MKSQKVDTFPEEDGRSHSSFPRGTGWFWTMADVQHLQKASTLGMRTQRWGGRGSRLQGAGTTHRKPAGSQCKSSITPQKLVLGSAAVQA